MEFAAGNAHQRRSSCTLYVTSVEVAIASDMQYDASTDEREILRWLW